MVVVGRRGVFLEGFCVGGVRKDNWIRPCCLVMNSRYCVSME